MIRRQATADRMHRLALAGSVNEVRKARGLRAFRRTAPTLSGGRLRTGGIHTRFLSPVSFDPTEFEIRRTVPEPSEEDRPKITLPTAGVARIHEPLGLRARRPVA